MCKRWRQGLALCLVAILASATVQRTYSRDEKIPVSEALKKPYLDLFEFAKDQRYTSAEINSTSDGLKRAQEMCISGFKRKVSQYGKDIEKAQKQLKDKGNKISDAERHDLHCRIQNLRQQQSQTDILISHAIPIAYENRRAKLDLIQQWPAKYKEIWKQIEDGTYRNRR